jgi:hypothetical protein
METSKNERAETEGCNRRAGLDPTDPLMGCNESQAKIYSVP